MDEVDFSEELVDVYDFFLEDETVIGAEVKYWEGTVCNNTHETMLKGNKSRAIIHFLEGLQEDAYELPVGVFNEGYLDDLLRSAPNIAELETIIIEWLDENANQPKLMTVCDEKEITGTWDGEEIVVNN